MKKIYGVISAILVVMGLWCFPAVAVEQTEIIFNTTVTSEEVVDVAYTYEITPSTQNNPGASNEPDSLLVSLAGVAPTGGVIKVSTPLSFAATNYANTGIYRYRVQEVATTNQTYPVSDKVYEIYVQVTRNANDEIVKQVYAQALDVATDVKGEMDFPHEVPMTYINVENNVQGALSNTGEYFRYRLEVLGPVGARYVVAGQDALVSYDGVAITTATEYEVKDGAENYLYVYLKGGQTLTVGLTSEGYHQIPVGTRYRLVKDQVNRWNTTINGQSFATETEAMDYLTTVLDPVTNKIIVMNEREFDVPMTAVFLNILPFVVLLAVAMVGIYLVKKVKNDEKGHRRVAKKGRKA